MANCLETMVLPQKRPLRGLTSRLILAGLVPGVCLCLTTAGWAAAAGNGAAASAGADYQRAVDSFNREDYAAAAALLDKIPDNGNSNDRADVLNLRGAIYLHQKHYEQARTFFGRARILDPGLWAASFNEAEANFQQKNYGESRRQFSELLVKTPQASHPEEWALVQYKTLLSSLLAGNEKPVRSYLAAHAKDSLPPASYFFLNAALEYQQSHQREAGQWLSRAAQSYSPVAQQVYAETFAQLGWPAPRGERPAVYAENKGNVVPLAEASSKSAAAFSAMDAQTASAQKLGPATLAVVQLIPGRVPLDKPVAKQPEAPSIEKPAFRFGGPMAIPLPAEEPAVQDSPPGSSDGLKSGPGVEGGMMVGGLADASVLARHRSNPTPNPTTPADSPPSDTPAGSAAGSASPAGGDATTASPAPSASGSPAASAAPGSSAPPALPAFVQKYEAAYVKFIQKDYDGARVLLDEADAIQPKQPSSISLRGQIFKHFYEAAYVAYLKADYSGAIAQLDEADIVQASQPDASNLRGLVYSRQHNYDRAEEMFKKAIQTDPTFWAAKFNLAELPFNYRNYTAARSRFEDLFSQTDPVKQPREAELTQFKVFLTLLLEGKEAGARSFMEHFTFSGATPARYFCQSALDFYHGDVDKAMGWLDSAKKEYPAQLVSIFIESFYRVGWMTDPSARTELAGGGTGSMPSASPAASVAAAATAAPTVVAKATPAPAASVSAAPAIAAATPAPAASVAAAPASIAKATPAPAVSVAAAPMLLAKATPAASVFVAATPALLAKATPAPVASMAPMPVIVAKATPVPAASVAATPVVIAKTIPTPAPSVAAAPAAVKPAPVPAVVAARPLASPSASVAAPIVAAQAPAATPAFSAEPIESAAPESAAATPGEETEAAYVSPAENVIRFLIVIVVLGQMIFVWTKVALAFRRRNAQRLGSPGGYNPSKAVEPDKVEAPR